MLRKYLFLLGMALTTNAYTQSHQFEIKDGAFMLDHQPIEIRAGELHYARVPEAYWRQRLQMMKAMGLNTVCTYVFWNYHHPSPGVWDFTSGNHNLSAFLQIAKETGLYVVLRPGPYACAEWDFGGFPWWLATVEGLKVRTDNKPYLDSCTVYFQKLAEQVRGYHISEGGPIILTQVENEFGSWVAQRKDIPLEAHLRYTAKIKAILIASGLKPPFYTSDGRTLFTGGHIEDVFPAANGEDDVDSLRFTVNQFNHGQGPYFVAEFYPGWLDHWAEEFPRVSTAEIVNQTKKYLDNHVSFSFYMIHGGTNFGYTSGANYTKEHPIQPDLTSYDYDAPISEAGWATEKYLSLRTLLQQYTKSTLPPVPDHAAIIQPAPIPISKTVDLFDWKEHITPVKAAQPLSFESLHQANGYVLYSIQVSEAVNGILHIPGLRDYATVYINGEKAGSLNLYYNQLELPVMIPASAKLDILVESMGRINYGPKMSESLKGILSPVYINEQALSGEWTMYPIPLENMPDLKAFNNKKLSAGLPAFYAASFKLDKTGDVFLDMQHWGKGVVFVNGHHLGRFWNKGPQQTLYLPGCWLHKGNNDIVVFDQENDHIKQQVESSASHILDALNP